MLRSVAGGVVGALVTLLAAGAVALAWLPDDGGRVVRPPDDVAVPRTATVGRERVTVTRTFAGEVVAAEQPSVLATDGIVTRLPAASLERVEPGSLVAEVNGRPMIALPMAFGLWRDLREGMTGPDVRQVQRGLQRLGLYSAGIDGAFGPATSAALRDLYRGVGHALPREVAPAADDGTAGARADGGGGESAGGVGDPAEPAPAPRVRQVAVLPSTEIVAISTADSAQRLLAPGVRVGTRLGGDLTLSLAGRGAAVQVPDGGALARDLGRASGADLELELIVDPAAPPVTAQVVQSSVDDDLTRIVLAAGTELEPGAVSGQVVIARTASPVLAVPPAAVMPDQTGRLIVTVVADDGSTKEVPVSVGLRGDVLVEVAAPGLAEGDLVSLP